MVARGAYCVLTVCFCVVFVWGGGVWVWVLFLFLSVEGVVAFFSVLSVVVRWFALCACALVVWLLVLLVLSFGICGVLLWVLLRDLCVVMRSCVLVGLLCGILCYGRVGADQ